MKKSAFNYQLPTELIAQQPPAIRGDSRLLQLDSAADQLHDKQFSDLAGLLKPGDLLVFNNTRVIPARLFGEKSTGGKVEVLIERLLENNRALAHIRASKSPKVGAELRLEGALDATMVARHDTLFELNFGEGEPLPTRLEQHGHMPLPPYIDRADEAADHERYQTVFAATPGAVAAPTAGLHFTDAMLEELAAKGVNSAFVTLHVGAGTFQPMRAETVEEHVMHAEWLCVDEAAVKAINDTKAAGGRVIAVGTTAVRSLETAAKTGTLAPYSGDTRLFITPGYRYHVVDAMVTNFHLPESTLLMLVSAFAGYQTTLKAYQHAIDQQYRFFSYGDAMFITRNPNATEDVPA